MQELAIQMEILLNPEVNSSEVTAVIGPGSGSESTAGI